MGFFSNCFWCHFDILLETWCLDAFWITFGLILEAFFMLFCHRSDDGAKNTISQKTCILFTFFLMFPPLREVKQIIEVFNTWASFEDNRSSSILYHFGDHFFIILASIVDQCFMIFSFTFRYDMFIYVLYIFLCQAGPPDLTT